MRCREAVVGGDLPRLVVDGDGSTAAASLFAAGDATHVRDGFVSEAIAKGVRAGTAASFFLQRAAIQPRVVV